MTETAVEPAVETADILDDLTEFARIELESGDLEPWAEMIRALRVNGAFSEERTYWFVKAYNAYDDLASAWALVNRWDSPTAWRDAPDAADAGTYWCTNERRNLRGGKVLQHLESYAAHLGGMEQSAWIRAAIVGDDPYNDYLRVLNYLRLVWGVGRQTAFEWAEFLTKALDVPIAAPDAQLWESAGPRRSLQRIYGVPNPTLQWLDDRAAECRDGLIERGVTLAWEDFETVICDFNVMRDGRYYPGRHLAALREEIESIDEAERGPLLAAWDQVVPERWRDIPPGIDKALMPVYRDTGKIVTPWTA